ncbi:MAG: NifU family protein [Actinomycetota bacterium]|nr:NifU family protein [Actinomycetota bacterium]
MPSPSNLRANGERIEHLLDASAAGGPLAKERAEELVRLVVELYGAGLERVLEIVHDAGGLNDEALDGLADDALVTSLLLVHGLHPYSVEERIERALIKVRPYLGSHGGDVELLAVTEEGVVQLRLMGSCDGCASSSVTLKLAVEGAIEEAAPEIIRIEVESPSTAPVTAGPTNLIPVSALTARLHPAEPESVNMPAWEPLPDMADIAIGELRQVMVGDDMTVVIGRVGTDLYAYRDKCPSCSSSVFGGVIERGLGGGAVITCPKCRNHYDVRQAGRGLDDASLHLDPLPLLDRGGVIEIAVPTAVPA